MSARRPRPRVGRSVIAGWWIALWSIGLLAAVPGIASLSGAAPGAGAPTSRTYGSDLPSTADPEQSRADRPTPPSWLGAALSTTSVVGAGTDRRPDPDIALPSVADDHADHRFPATVSHLASVPDHSPLEQVSHHLCGSRAPPNSQI